MPALRRSLSTLAGATLLVAGLASPVSAAGPTTASGSVYRDRPDLSHDVLRMAHTTHTGIHPQSFPAEAAGLIAYQRSPFNAFPSHIWVYGDVEKALTTNNVGTGDSWPSWSPGGTLLTFTRDLTSSTTDGDSYDIYTITADGAGLKRLTNGGKADYNSSFSPDGSRIVFTSERTGGGDIYSMKIDGSDVKRLTTSSALDTHARWSPDGKKIAFTSERSGSDDVYVMNADGSSQTRLTTSASADFAPDWSPSGEVILFTTNRNTGQLDIYRMTAAGASQTNLTSANTAHNLYSRFEATGGRYQFTSDPFGDFDIYANTLAGGALDPLIETSDDEYNAEWQPVPSFPLVDARFSTFNADIQWVYDQGITKGCSAERYCPDDTVTRAQMASFLVRALDLPPTATDYFTDDEGLPAEGDINRVAAAGITSGCATGKYCPTDTVTRGAMASFLARAFALPATATDYFTDDTGTTHESNINKVAAAGITSGCTPTTYCPSADVTRGQMAAFLRRALE